MKGKIRRKRRTEDRNERRKKKKRKDTRNEKWKKRIDAEDQGTK